MKFKAGFYYLSEDISGETKDYYDNPELAWKELMSIVESIGIESSLLGDIPGTVNADNDVKGPQDNDPNITRECTGVRNKEKMFVYMREYSD
jgi:hypothetical protein